MEINHFKVVDTTMEIANKYLDSKPSFTTVYADYQKKGRGRSLNRRWITSIENKNMLLSTIIRKEDISISNFLIPLVSGCAIRETLKDLFNIDTKIKWPNDIILNNKKICGIICESHKDGIIIGVGLNVYEKEFDKLEYKVLPSSLYNEKVNLDIEQDKQIKIIIDTFLLKLKELIKDYNFIDMIDNNLYMKNKEVRFSYEDAISIDNNKAKIISGIIKGISKDGALLIDNKKYYSGELLL